MSVQDKIERILKRIHVLLAEGQPFAGDSDKVIVDKNEVFSTLEELNLIIYEMMEQYEATSQSRELAQRRSEKKGEELIERVSRQTEEVYAASLIYTDDALNKIYHLMTEALNASQNIWSSLSREVEQEQRKIKEDQLELREQLQDFKDSNKYLNIIQNYNREQQEKASPGPEKKIQNQAKHYPMKIMPEIKVNPAYFERRGLRPDGSKIEPDIPDPTPEILEEAPKPSVIPEIKVDLDAEYFKWQEENQAGTEGEEPAQRSRRERWSLFGKK